MFELYYTLMKNTRELVKNIFVKIVNDLKKDIVIIYGCNVRKFKSLNIHMSRDNITKFLWWRSLVPLHWSVNFRGVGNTVARTQLISKKQRKDIRGQKK